MSASVRDVVLIIGVLMAIVSVGVGIRRNPFGPDHDGEIARWIIGLGTGMGLTIAGLAVAVWPGDSGSDLVVIDSLQTTGDAVFDDDSTEGDATDGDPVPSADDEPETSADEAEPEPPPSSLATPSAGVPISSLGLADTAEHCGVQATVVVLGSTYRDVWGCENSTRYTTEGSSEFDLGTRFSSFSGFVAVSDSSPAATVTRVEVTVGDEVVSSVDVSVGDRVPLEFDVSGEVRIGLHTERIEGDVPALVVLVGELDGQDASAIVGPSAEPGGSGVSIATLGLGEYAEHCGAQATVVVLGSTYRDVWGCENSTRYTTEGSSEFDLGTRFSSFSGFVAVSDSSPAATVTRVEVTVGDEVVYSGDVSVGDRVPVEFDVTGAVRIGLHTERIEGDVPALVVLVGELDGQDASAIVGPAPEPGGSGVPIATLGLAEYAEHCAEQTTVVVAGETYRDVWGCENSTRYTTEGSSEFDLGTRFSSFSGFVAVSDSSPAATVTRVEVTVGDEVVSSVDVTVGDRVPLEFDVSGEVRIGLHTERIEGDVPALVVLVGELDGQDASAIVGPSAEPGGSGVSIATLGLGEYAEHCGAQATVVVLGSTYRDVWGCENSTRYTTEGSSEFDLGTRFSSFSGFVAVSDSSPAATVTRVEVTVGDEVVYSGDVSVGDRVPVEFDVTGAVRIGLHTERIEGDVPALVVLVGELDGQDASAVVGPAPEPGGSGVPIATLGLAEYAEHCAEQTTVVVAGETYRDVWGCENSTRYTTEGSSEFDLGTRFSSFSGFVAVSDSSPAATVTRVEVMVGDEVVSSVDVTVGDRVPLEFDVTGAVRIGLHTERIEGDVPALVVLVGELD